MKIKNCVPCGYQVLLELLTDQEVYNTKIIVNDQKNKKEYHAIVLAIGPGVKDEHGFKVGDRVLLSGPGVPVPNFDDSEREKILMEPHCIKAVLC